MIRINTLDRCGETLTIELMGYINKTEFAILHDCLQEYAEEGIDRRCASWRMKCGASIRCSIKT